jgi:hypothetical protein
MTNCQKQLAARAASLLLLVLISACRRELCIEATKVDARFDGECLESIDTSYRSRITVVPSPKCPWPRLIDLSIFADFSPGLTSEQARRRFGTPDEEIKTDTRQAWRYNRPGGIVEISHEDQGSGFIPMYWWILRSYPKGGELSEVFPKAVVDRLPPAAELHEVAVLNQCGLPMVDVLVINGQVKVLTWIDNPGSHLDQVAGNKQ